MKTVKNDEDAAMTLAKFLVTMAVLPFAMIAFYVAMLPLNLFYTWMQLHLWNWFAVPYLHLPVLTFWQIFALGLILASCRVLRPKEDGDTQDITIRIWMYLLYQVLTFLVGYILHLTLLKG